DDQITALVVEEAVLLPAPPGVVFVWSQQRATGDPEPLGALPALRPPYRLMVGGPGWWGDLPRAAVRVGSLEDAVRAITAALT
ncbi:hypothetical protein AB0K48_50540, partial [Nonomuraea sp. NPDC055795]